MATSDRGFASMSKADRQRIARMGGKASGRSRAAKAGRMAQSRRK